MPEELFKELRIIFILVGGVCYISFIVILLKYFFFFIYRDKRRNNNILMKLIINTRKRKGYIYNINFKSFKSISTPRLHFRH